MRSSYVPDPLGRWIIFSVMLLFAPSLVFGQEFRSYWKFGLNLGFNEARTTCRNFEQPRNAGVWLGGNGACQGAWSDLYTQTYLRNPERNQAWVRFDANLYVNLNGERKPTDEQIKIGNSNLFIESGGVLGRDALIWGGKRYYKHEQLWVLGMNIMTQEGPGFGVYNIDVAGVTRLGLAWFHNVSNQDGPLQTAIDTRFEEIPLGDGRLNLINVYTETGSSDALTGEDNYEPLSGNKSAIIYKLWTPDSSHQTAFVYGRGLYGGSDEENFEQGPLIDSNGAWRNYMVFRKGFAPLIRDAVLKSSTVRVGHQSSYYPADRDWNYNAAIGLQRVSFGGLRFAEAGRIYERPDMDTLAVTFKPAYNIRSTVDVEGSLSYLKVINGLGFRHRLSDSGNLQESLRPVDQRLTNVSFSLNLKPVGRWQQKFSLYAGRSWWNEAIRRDINRGYFPERTTGYYAGVSTYWEM